MVPVTADEAAACATRGEWLRLFVARNPTFHALEVSVAYGFSGQRDRLGWFASFREIELVQLELGAGGVSAEQLAKSEARAAARRAQDAQRKAEAVAITVAELARAEDRRLVQLVWLRLLAREEARSSGGLALSPAAANVWHAMLLDADVNNGGFDQYFGNRGVADARLGVDALRAIGAGRSADIAAAAVLHHQRKYPTAARGEYRPDPELDALAKQYHAVFPRRGPGMASVVARYVRAHLEAF